MSCLKLHTQNKNQAIHVPQTEQKQIEPDISCPPFLPVIHSKVMYL